MARLSDAEQKRLQVAFVTTDPARDTRPALRTYLDRFDPTSSGVTGPLEQIEALAKPMDIFIKHGQKLASGGYEVNHGTVVVAVRRRRRGPRVDGRDLALRHGRRPAEDPEGRRMTHPS